MGGLGKPGLLRAAAELLRIAVRRVLEHPPKLADVARALRRIDGDRLGDHRFDRVTHRDAHRSRRGSPLRIERAIGVFADVLALDGRAIGEQLDDQHRERVDVGLRANRAERLVKLLGRGVGRA